ncbi:hypothetical protein ACZ90_48845 [Streptomyces albus subsp. albus]|nr:hypothetical protein ACZ90_48845 [Streptomyces albus subsp. albus]
MAEKSIEIGDLRELIADVLDITPDAVTEDAHFIEDLGVDSLLALELAVSLERTYEIKIESHEIVDVQRLRDVHELMQRKLASA